MKQAAPRSASGRSLEEHAEEFRVQGFTILENLLSPVEVDNARQALDEVFEAESDIAPTRNWRNKSYTVSYMLPQKHPLFRSFCFSEPVLELMRLLLGERYVLGSMNGFTTTPGGEKQQLHIDQAESSPGQILTINATHTLDEFTIANGCTRAIPGSQDRTWVRGVNPDQFESETVYLEAPVGSLIAFNGGIWHAGSQNTTNKPRRAVHAFFHRPWIVPQWDYPRSLSPDVVEQLSPEQKRLFGFGSVPPRYDYEERQIVRARV